MARVALADPSARAAPSAALAAFPSVGPRF
jgi:hypothetical protein